MAPGVTRAVLRARKLACILLTVACLVVPTARGLGAGEVLQEYELKALFLFNFTKFVDWPDKAFKSPSSPLVIGVVGDDPFGDILERAVGNKTVNQRSLTIKRFSGVTDVGDCHILFVSRSEEKNLSLIRSRFWNSPVLTVSEIRSFARSFGIIELFTMDRKVRFKVNVEAAQAAGLKINAQLLALASEVVHRDAEK